ncbi:helix-turn-helix domain-containing protein [Planococcus liqunii]|uniref:Helix-turn-helix domain-containing protein n=1 Tax=Planococcus liqunii TaxID=3058394 RepID=A0ABT8MU64_9BACL|nr:MULTISPECIES: helix-turn-helix domain-containing protein [unclassified Planococcus (in: firmicutes)]MDN7228299.1 helix-turn-helix domain-containing protein [Planococcus sp. N064]WKA50809.1 helix-turn-helix domain-containing protein [Planococcus sp. N056]
MENIQGIISKNLANLRKRRNLTLDQVSEATGVSKAMLAQIEKGKSNPTVATLWKIANGLQVSFTSFMTESEPQVKQISLTDIEPITDNEGRYRVYPFFPFHPDKKFEIYVTELEPGCFHQAKTHLGEEYIVMKNGELIMDLQGQRYTLASGDALQFSGTVPHSYKNETAEPASFFMLMFYPENEI